jgi:hypothetical protein
MWVVHSPRLNLRIRPKQPLAGSELFTVSSCRLWVATIGTIDPRREYASAFLFSAKRNSLLILVRHFRGIAPAERVISAIPLVYGLSGSIECQRGHAKR